MVGRFNGVSNRGRVCAVMILLDHAFEMLLKAGLLHRGGSIRLKGSSQTLGLDACIRKALTDGSLRFLDNNQALTIQTLTAFVTLVITIMLRFRSSCYISRLKPA